MAKFASTDDMILIGKESVISLCSVVPFASGFVRFIDAVQNEKEHSNIREEMQKIWIAIGQNPLNIQNRFLSLVELAQDPARSNVDFRKLKSCMAIMRELSDRSKEGQANDPIISIESCQEILIREIQPEDPLLEIRLVCYELDKEGFIYRPMDDAGSPLGFSDIWPTNDFFWRTDHIFQDWSPEEDARTICRLVIDKMKGDQYQARTEVLEYEFKWKPRRLNPALAYLYYNDLIHHDDEPGGITYVLPEVRLNEEAYFFINDKKQLKV